MGYIRIRRLCRDGWWCFWDLSWFNWYDKSYIGFYLLILSCMWHILGFLESHVPSTYKIASLVRLWKITLQHLEYSDPTLLRWNLFCDVMHTPLFQISPWAQQTISLFLACHSKKKCKGKSTHFNFKNVNFTFFFFYRIEVLIVPLWMPVGLRCSGRGRTVKYK